MATGIIDVTRVVSEQNDLINGHDNTANTTSKVFTPIDSVDSALCKTDGADHDTFNINEENLPTADEVSKNDKVPADTNLQEKSQESELNDHKVSEEAERAFLDLFRNLPNLTTVVEAWSDFKRNYDQERNHTEEHAIEVLQGDPVVPHHIWRNRRIRQRPIHLKDHYQLASLQIFANTKDASDITSPGDPRIPITKPEILREAYHPIPERIRINGEPLRQLFEKALELEFSAYSGSIVLLKPYKLLVQHEEQIRHMHEQLARKFASSEIPEITVKNENGKNFLDTYGTEQAFEELRCLIEFMDSRLSIVKQFNNGGIFKLAFADLWHIFEPGHEVITSTDPINAYRVLHVTGGRPYLSPPEDGEGDDGDDDNSTRRYRVPEKSSDLIVTCYQIGFDGKKFGPITHSFSIQNYEGYQDITTLPIYPLKFAKSPDEIQQALKDNGQLFIEVCKGKHVQYRGMNLYETEEIDSEVVVDFHAALWDTQDKDEGWEHAIEFGIKSPTNSNKAEVVMVSNYGCQTPQRCENDAIFDDSSIDHQRMEDFLMKKTWLTTSLRNLDGNSERIPEEDLILFSHRLFAFVLKDQYYQGILFLTTNRVGKIDEAFRSRVHISLYYPPLDKQSTVDIFKTNLQRVKLQKQDLIRTKDEKIEKFAKSHYDCNDAHVRWNGRQIRNAFHIAVALAETEAMAKAKDRGNDKKPLKLNLRTKHFLKVENASIRFDDYLTSVLGADSAKLARQKSNRQDTWSERSHEEQKSNRRSRGEIKRKQRYRVTSSDSGDSSEDSIDGASASSEGVDDARQESRSESSNEESESSEGESAEGRKRESKKSKGTTRKQPRSRDRDGKGKSHSKKSQK
ncbi:hypothetical protein MKX08_002299 [Trichoderma sp. CBMAI-0020]|nr:hypothetical protein MKX08_002299 [Trichoderma sp. CBMAI-0020]